MLIYFSIFSIVSAVSGTQSAAISTTLKQKIIIWWIIINKNGDFIILIEITQGRLKKKIIFGKKVRKHIIFSLN